MVINTVPGRVYFLSFWATFSCFNGVLHGQEFKSLKMYEKSLIDFYRLQRTAEREEFKDFKEKLIGRYLPDVGLQFGLSSVQFRFSNYFEERFSLRMGEKFTFQSAQW